MLLRSENKNISNLVPESQMSAPKRPRIACAFNVKIYKFEN